MNRVIFLEDEVIGYVDDIKREIGNDTEQEAIDLMKELESYGFNYPVRCWLHPTGNWVISHLANERAG